MTKEITVSMKITVEGSKLSINLNMDEVATLGDVVTVCQALENSAEVTSGQLRSFIEKMGDAPQDEWLNTPASKVLLQEP